MRERELKPVCRCLARTRRRSLPMRERELKRGPGVSSMVLMCRSPCGSVN